MVRSGRSIRGPRKPTPLTAWHRCDCQKPSQSETRSRNGGPTDPIQYAGQEMLLEVTRERPAVLPADRATLLIEHASEVVTLGWSFGDGARGGLWQGDPGLIHDGAIAIGGDGRVLAVGPSARVRDSVDLSPKARIYNANGCSIIPGFID